MKVYLAAYFGWQEQMRIVRRTLLEQGHTVTSRWLDVEHRRMGPDDLLDSDDLKLASEFAVGDVNDVNGSDMLVCFNTLRHQSVGRHIELGMAYAWGIQCVVVGPREIVFHALPSIMHFDHTQAFLDYMKTADETLPVRLVQG